MTKPHDKWGSPEIALERIRRTKGDIPRYANLRDGGNLPRKPFKAGVDLATKAVIVAAISALVGIYLAWLLSGGVTAYVPTDDYINCFTGKTTGC